MNKTSLVGLAATCILLVVACGGSAPDGAETPAPEAADGSAPAPAAADITPDLAAIQAAVDAPGRPDADRADDAGRKPGEVLGFFGVQPGWHALDLFGGSGYYSEIIARAVGESGHVTLHTNEAYAEFAGEAVEQRMAGGELPNISVLTAEANDLALEPESFDMVLMALVYHDVYFAPPEGGWKEIDAPGLLAKLRTALKPGGVLAVIDHAAVAGADPNESVNSLHRIDEELVKSQMEAAGFVLDATSDLLRNSNDDRTVSVFDESMRRKSDRFIHRYRKPVG